MARREVPLRTTLIANQQKIQQMYQAMQDAADTTSKREWCCAEKQPFKAMEEQLKCIVCFEVARDPFSCPKCQHLSCRPCLDTWFTTVGNHANATAQKVCPGCRFDLTSFELQVNRLAHTLIETLSSSDRMWCSKHDHSELLFFCNTCTQPLCTDAMVEDQEHRQHEYQKLSKVFGDAKERVSRLMDQYSDLKSDCKAEIANYQHLLHEERRKNESKLAEFMKSVDEQLQLFQADEERVSARLQGLMKGSERRLSEIEESEQSMNARSGQLSKVDLVRQADQITQEIQEALKIFQERKKNLPKATSAEDLFKLLTPSLIDTAVADQKSTSIEQDAAMEDHEKVIE